MRFGSLFSGIGGLDLGLGRAGMECAWQVEIDPFCRKVLTKHWPNVPKFEDVKECGKHNLERVDLIAGGFPCQDISVAGKRAGIDGERSGLWCEFARIVGDLRPRFVLVENVSEMLRRGMGRVLGDLAAFGYGAEWHCLPAAYFGAKHIRDRVFLLAYSGSDGLEGSILFSDSYKAEFDSYYRRAITRTLEPANTLSWTSEPAFLGKDDDVPYWLERIKGTGNAVVPQVAEWIGKRILEAA